MNLVERASQSLISFTKVQDKQPQPIAKGQVIVGKVIEVDGEGFARIKIGNSECLAKIQMPLKENGTYAFVVSGVDGNQVELKMANSQLGDRLGQIVNTILSEWGIEPSNDARQLLEVFLKSGKGVTKEDLVSMLQLIKGPVQKADIQALLLILERNLPVEQGVFEAVKATQQPTTLKDQILNVLQLAAKSQISSSVEPLKEWVQTNLGQPSIPVFETKETALKNNPSPALPLKEIAKLEGEIAQLFNKLSSKEPTEIKQALLEKVIVQPSVKLESKEMQFLKNTFPQITEGEWNNLLKGDTATVKSELASVLSKLDFKSEIKLLASLSQFSRILIDGDVEDNPILLNTKVELRNQSATGVERKVVAEVPTKEMNMSVPSEMSTSGLAKVLKSSIETLGLQWESFVRKETIKEEQLFHQLKPALLLLAKDDSLPGQLMREVDQLVTRLTGMQLLAGHSEGPIDYLSLQIPMNLAGLSSDIQLKWEGKRRSDGKIDPDFCRIFFHLELDTIGMTSLDVQIVNRVVGIQIYCEEDVSLYVDELKKDFEVGLLNLGYKIGNVAANIPLSEGADLGINIKNQPVFTNQSGYKGVDFRV